MAQNSLKAGLSEHFYASSNFDRCIRFDDYVATFADSAVHARSLSENYDRREGSSATDQSILGQAPEDNQESNHDIGCN